MIMKRWRVGSFSMGLILVASGILMLISLVVQVNVMNVLLTFWPVILISIGIEILLHLFVKKNEDGDGGKIRYDALSILFISFLLVISVGFYAVSYYAGLFETREDLYATLGIMNENVYLKNSETLNGTKELMVFNGFESITVLSAADKDLKVEYSISASTHDRSMAEGMLGDVIKLEPGERAYLRTETAMFRNNLKVGWPAIDCVIYLPKGTILDLSQYQGRLEYDNVIEEQIIRARDGS